MPVIHCNHSFFFLHKIPRNRINSIQVLINNEGLYGGRNGIQVYYKLFFRLPAASINYYNKNGQEPSQFLAHSIVILVMHSAY